MDPKKIKAVVQWKRLTSMMEVPNFEGLTSFHRRSAVGILVLAARLTRLTWKKINFQWSNKCEQSFQEVVSLFIVMLARLEIVKPHPMPLHN